MSFYKYEPAALDMVDVGTKTEGDVKGIGVLSLPRINGYSTDERDFYVSLLENEITGSEEILDTYSKMLFDDLEWQAKGSNLTVGDLNSMFGALGEHEEFQKEVEEDHPQIMSKFYTALNEMYLDIEVAKAFTMFKVRLATVLEKAADIMEIKAFTFEDMQNPLKINLSLVRRLSDFADAESHGDKTLDYSLFSAPEETYKSPVASLTEEVLDILNESAE